jgi:uncharacterized protein YcfJ
MSRLKPLIIVAGAAALAGCATQPIGPSVAVMPGPNKPFEAFQQDQAVCRQFADQQIGGPNAEREANNRQIGTAVVGTVLGAGLGAALGGGQGAAIGAGAGALGGTAVGASGAQSTQYSLQQRYDIAYEQCMYSRGNQVPGFAVVNTGATPWSAGQTITPAPAPPPSQ